KQDGVLLPNTSVRVENYDGSGPEGYSNNSTSTDANGHFSISGIPFGLVRVTSNGSVRGFVEQNFAPGSSPFDIQLDFNSALFKNYNVQLQGADSFLYSVSCDGSIEDGHSINGGNYAFSYAFTPFVN